MTTRRHHRGFSLMELMVACGIIAVMTALSFGFMTNMFTQTRVNEQTRMVQGLLQSARRRAVSFNLPVGVYIGKAQGITIGGTSQAQSTQAVWLFYDNTSATATSIGSFGSDDTIIDGPRFLPYDRYYNQVIVQGAPLITGLPAAPTNDTTTQGYAIIYSNYGIPSVSGTGNVVPLTINLLQAGSPVTTRSILVAASGAPVVQ